MKTPPATAGFFAWVGRAGFGWEFYRVNAGVEANALFPFSWLRFGIFDADL